MQLLRTLSRPYWIARYLVNVITPPFEVAATQVHTLKAGSCPDKSRHGFGRGAVVVRSDGEQAIGIEAEGLAMDVLRADTNPVDALDAFVKARHGQAALVDVHQLVVEAHVGAEVAEAEARGLLEEHAPVGGDLPRIYCLLLCGFLPRGVGRVLVLREQGVDAGAVRGGDSVVAGEAQRRQRAVDRQGLDKRRGRRRATRPRARCARSCGCRPTASPC